MTRWVKLSNVDFKPMTTEVGFNIAKGVVAHAPAYMWIIVAVGLSLGLGLLIGMSIGVPIGAAV